MLKLKSFDYKVYLCAFAHILFSIYTDSIVFGQDNFYERTIYIILKSVFLVTVIFLWKFIFFLVHQLKEKNPEWIKKTKIFLIYFGSMMLFLCFVWPGIWVWDEFGVYHYSVSLNYFYWQHYLTSVYYIFAMMFFPFAGGILIFQLILIGLIHTFIMYDLSLRTRHYKWLYILFFLPPVLINTLDPIRITMYAYILLFVLYYLYFRIIRKKEVTFKQILPVILLSPFVIVWRAEGLIFFPFILLLLLIGAWKKLSVIKQVSAVLLILVFTISLNNPQKIWATHNKDYSLTAMLNPLSMLLQYPNLNRMEELKKDLSSYINLEILKQNPSAKETPAFWAYRDQLIVSQDNKDFERFKKAYIQLVLANPVEFLTVRKETFWLTSGMVNDEIRRWRTGAFDINNRKDYVVEVFVSKNKLNKTGNLKVRNSVVNILEGSNPMNTEKTLWHYHITWNLFIMYGVLLGITVVAIFRKDIPFLILCGALWCTSVGIFITAPASYFMYYFPIYLVVYILGIGYLIDRSK